jgi:predicted transposase YdaD
LQGEERGEQRGKILEAQKLVKRQLKRRVGEIEKSLIQQVEAVPIEALE